MKGLIARMRDAVMRAREGLVRHGAKGFVREAVLHAKRSLWLREEHVWYERDLAELAPVPALEDPLRLIAGAADELDVLKHMRQSVASARRRLAEGHAQMLLFEGERLVFCCCIFRGQARVLAAPGKRLLLPDGTVCVEDAYTDPGSRRRGFGMLALLAVLAHLRDEGVARVIAKAAATNTAPRQALLKCGFQEIARVRLQRRGPRKRVEVEVLNASPSGVELARRLGQEDARRVRGAGEAGT